MFASPGQIAFRLFNFPIHWYGITMAFAIIVGLSFVSFIRRRYYNHIPREFVLDLSFYLILGGIIGARLYYVVLDAEFYLKHPLEMIAVWHGGLSIHGAIIGSIIVGAFIIKKYNQNFFEIADLFSYGLVLGQSIGRWGNFFNSEAFGIPTNLPWKVFIPIESRPIQFFNVNYFHPTFLYESIANLFILLVLFFILRKKEKNVPGGIFFSYLIMYSVVRYCIESLRLDSILNIAGIPIAQVVSILFLMVGLVGLISVNRYSKDN